MIAAANPTKVHAAHESKLDNWTRQEVKRVTMKPVDQLSRPDIEAELKKGARENHMTLIGFADRVFTRLKRDYPDETEHAAWFQKNFSARG